MHPKKPHAIEKPIKSPPTRAPRFALPNIDGIYCPKAGAHTEANGKITVGIHIPASRLGYEATEGDLEFVFTVDQRKITISPYGYVAHDDKNMDWYSILSENERVRIFQYLMAEYRARAIGNERWQVAAIGVTEDNELFIASNTRPKHQEYKKCAEANVIAAALENATASTAEGFSKRLMTNTPKPMFKDFFVMGGNDSLGISIVCPCGSCTDELRDHMSLKKPDKLSADNTAPRNLYMLPTPMASKKNSEGLGILPDLTIDSQAANLSKLPKDACWKISIDGLYGLRNVPLIREYAHMQTHALKSTLKEHDKHKIYGEYSVQEHRHRNLMRLKDLTLQALEAEQTGTSTVNIEAEFFKTLNTLMASTINGIVIERVTRIRAQGHEINQATLNKYIQAVRCVVVQFEDGSYSLGTEARSTLDKSAPCAEFNAIMPMQETIPHVRVTKAWCMEMNPKSIEHSEMPLPLKDRLERLAKYSDNPHEMQYSFIPFNSGSKEHITLAGKIMATYTLPEIFKGLFVGKREAERSFVGRLTANSANIPARY